MPMSFVAPGPEATALTVYRAPSSPVNTLTRVEICARFHAGDTPSPSADADALRRAEAGAELRAAAHAAPRPRIPGESDCWVLWGPGVPCLHPDGLGHVGPHGANK